MGWLSKALAAKSEAERAELKSSSGDFPRFDRILAAAFCRPEHLRSSFGVRFNAYLDECELGGSEVRGRVMLNYVAREYDTDRNSGAIMTALELYNLPAPQDNASALRQWRDKSELQELLQGPSEASEPSEAVSAPRAGGEEGDEEDEVWVDGLPPNHLMTHLPKSNQCDTCLRAKLYEAPLRRRENQRDVLKDARSREDPKGPMERVAVDFVIAQDLVSQTGEKVALVSVDKYSGMIGVHPCEDRSSEEVEKAMRHFFGTKAIETVEVGDDRGMGPIDSLVPPPELEDIQGERDLEREGDDERDKGPVSGIPDERASDIEARLSRGPEPAPRAVGVEEEAEDQGSSGYAATTPIDSEIGDFEFEDPDAIQISEDKDVQEVPEMSGAMVNLNAATLDEEFRQSLQERRDQSRKMVSSFSELTDLAVEKEIQQDPKAIESIRKEVEDIRAMGVWDDNSVTEYEQVKSQAKRNGEEIHLAEGMGLKTIEGFPSLWWDATTRVLVAAYVDDIVCAGISRWSVNHDKMLHRLVSYMNATADYGVHCFVNGNPSDISFHLYTDADLGGDVCTMKSHTGIFLCIECPNGTLFPISWSSRRQQCVSKSTTESELVALNDGLYGDALPVQTVLQLIFERDIPLVLHEDNQACIQILNAGYSARLKSMNRTHKLSIAAISETIKDLNLELRYTVSEEQLADLFTKVLARVKFTEALRKLRIGPASLTF
ncbi:unnamed protein product [Cladocopium goreaui]|uniref:Retrovirus-related Pol polyprotein from transposon RE2 (Retro element 2) (AtRE2) n=1 Tax=Cladocopium goreaui TaxID=2562237 RepID=A0A9P1FHP8_9DINO|nr:unnamed protein product [Cladocopium goreaui]